MKSNSTGAKLYQRETISIDETKNIYQSPIALTGAIGLLTGKIGTYLGSRANPILNPCLRVLIDNPESYFLKSILNNKSLISIPTSNYNLNVGFWVI